MLVKLQNLEEGNTLILASNGEEIGTANHRYKLLKDGVCFSKIHINTSFIDVVYWGAGNNPFDIHA
jgi:hypothetical protein